MKPAFLCALWLISTFSLLSAAPVGHLTSLEGEVWVVRQGKTVAPAKLREGFDLEIDDALSTGNQGHAELLLDKAGGVPATIRLGTATSVALDITALKREQIATIDLLAGSLQVTLATVAGNSQLAIRTAEALLTTKMASFRVVMALGGELAVSSSSGRVQCQVGELAYQAEPGAVVVVSPNPTQARSLNANATTLESWNQSWKAARDTDIRNRAAGIVKFYATRYLQTSGQLLRAWARWEREGQAVWALWSVQDGTRFSAPAVLSDEKRTVASLAVALRTLAVRLERDSLRLQELRSLATQAVVPESLEVTKDYTLREFSQQFDRDLPGWQARFSSVRWLHREFTQRNEGEFPSAGTVPDVTKDSPFFN